LEGILEDNWLFFPAFSKNISFFSGFYKKTICKMEKMGYNGRDYYSPAGAKIPDRRCPPWQSAENPGSYSEKPAPW
jgi:hypothetical protein